VTLNQVRATPDSREFAPDRSLEFAPDASREVAPERSRGPAPERDRPWVRARGLEPGEESPAFPPLRDACPVTAAEAGGYGTGPAVLPPRSREAGLAEAGPYGAGTYEAEPYEAGSYEAGSYEAGSYEAGPWLGAASMSGPAVAEPVVVGHRPSDIDNLMISAERFITLFHSENGLCPPDRRLAHVRREIEATGTYRHTQEELTFGAQVAWRNSSRCIGRLYWQSLRVRDRRDVTSAAEVVAESVMHLREATNGGRIRPVITVFAPDAPGLPGPRILNSQLVGYAGYETLADTILGDPANADLTRLARDLGWRGRWPAGRFDLLPLLVRGAGEPATVHELPRDAVLEIAIEHPEFPWFAGLGLRWHAVPVISDMYLDIGGVRYPAAPFNGWYMCTEIGSRDFGDSGRYDQLPVIAAHMGLATASDENLWKDKALTELNLAVLHSFSAAGVTITDHHTESVRFLQHVGREERHGRTCPADWSWIVPPAASSATPVFHRHYEDVDQTPNFYRHPAPTSQRPPKVYDLRQRVNEVVALCRHRGGGHALQLWMLDERIGPSGERQLVTVRRDVGEDGPHLGNLQRSSPSQPMPSADGSYGLV
jgi:nitric-oxide synthase